MAAMIRRSVVPVVVVLLLLAAATVGTQESLRITPFINDNRVVVSFELNDAYNDGVREAIASGLRTTFTYELQLRTPAWIDRTIGTTVVLHRAGHATALPALAQGARSGRQCAAGLPRRGTG